MTKKGVLLIVLMMTIALLGLIGMQAYYISESYQLNARLFDQGVMTAMNNVSRKIEKADAARFMKEKIAPPQLPELPRFDTELFIAQAAGKDMAEEATVPPIVTVQPYKGINIISFRNSRGDFQTDISFSLLGLTRRLALPDFIQFLENTVNTQVAVRNGQVYYKESPPFGITPHELREKVLEHRKIVEKQLTSGPANDENTPKDIRFLQINPGGQAQPITSAELQEIQRQMAAASRRQQNLTTAGNLEQKLKKFIDSLENFNERVRVFEELAAEMQSMYLPLQERVNLQLVDSLLKSELQNQGINLPYDVEIRATDSDSMLFASYKTSGDNDPELYKTALFPQEVVKGMSGEIMLKIPNKNRYLVRKMNMLTGSSGELILVIIFCF